MNKIQLPLRSLFDKLSFSVEEEARLKKEAFDNDMNDKNVFLTPTNIENTILSFTPTERKFFDFCLTLKCQNPLNYKSFLAIVFSTRNPELYWQNRSISQEELLTQNYRTKHASNHYHAGYC